MKATFQLFTAIALALASTAPALAESSAMPEDLTREIRTQGSAALQAMTAEGTRLDARQRALTTLGAALERSAPVMAARDTAAVVPCAEARPLADGRTGAQPLSLPTIRLPQLPQLR